MNSPARVAGVLLLAFVTLGIGVSGAQDGNPAKAEAELKAVRAQIDKVKAEMERDSGRRDKLAREIEESEKSVSSARVELD
jgi:septal ring factor EnvC (AmiA/AmiB activator)